MTASDEDEVERAIQQAIEALALGYPVGGTVEEQLEYLGRLGDAIEACAPDVQARYLKA